MGKAKKLKIKLVKPIINWVEEKGEELSDNPQDEEIPEITEIDELQIPHSALLLVVRKINFGFGQ